MIDNFNFNPPIGWEDGIEFPNYQDEDSNRKMMNRLHMQVRDYLNTYVIPLLNEHAESLITKVSSEGIKAIKLGEDNSLLASMDGETWESVVGTGPQGEKGEGIPTGGATGAVLLKSSSVDYDSEWAYLSKDVVGLTQVDNTADLDKPISTATQAALDAKATKASVMNVTLVASEWNEDAELTLTIDGINNDTRVELLPSVGMETDLLSMLQGANIQEKEMSDNTIVVKAYGSVPTADLPARLLVGGE